MRLVVVVGNPKPQSRTRAVAELLAQRIAELSGASHELTIDLCEFADTLFRWPDETLTKLSVEVASADIVVVASPTYKASYTGLLKAFLDRYPSGGLCGTTAIPVMTASDPLHGLAVEFTLRPLLVELGASVPTRGMFFLTPRMDEAPILVDAWLHTHENVLSHISLNMRGHHDL